MKELFIIGSPRSGTSLLRMLLTSHPEVVIPPECHFFLWLEDKYSSWNSAGGLDSFIEDLYACTKFETWGLDRSSLMDTFSSRQPESYAELVAAVYLAYGHINGKETPTYWGDKNGLWADKLPTIPKHFPKARFIHIVRDGRDVACSYRELAAKEFTSRYAPSLPADVEVIARRWTSDVSAIRQLLSLVPAGNSIEIHYEDLVSQTVKVLSAICQFLNLEYSDDMLYFRNQRPPPLFEPEEFRQWKPKLAAPPDAKNIGKYKTQLDSTATTVFEGLAADHLRHYHYLP